MPNLALDNLSPLPAQALASAFAPAASTAQHDGASGGFTDHLQRAAQSAGSKQHDSIDGTVASRSSSPPAHESSHGPTASEHRGGESPNSHEAALPAKGR